MQEIYTAVCLISTCKSAMARSWIQRKLEFAVDNDDSKWALNQDRKMNKNETKNRWKLEKDMVLKVVEGVHTTWGNMQTSSMCEVNDFWERKEVRRRQQWKRRDREMRLPAANPKSIFLRFRQIWTKWYLITSSSRQELIALADYTTGSSQGLNSKNSHQRN